MKTAKQWFDEYAVSHQNETNQLVHYICVPVIFFSVIGLLMSIPTSFLENFVSTQKKEARNKKTINAFSFEFLNRFLYVFTILYMPSVNYLKNNLGNCF